MSNTTLASIYSLIFVSFVILLSLIPIFKPFISNIKKDVIHQTKIIKNLIKSIPTGNYNKVHLIKYVLILLYTAGIYFVMNIKQSLLNIIVINLGGLTVLFKTIRLFLAESNLSMVTKIITILLSIWTTAFIILIMYFTYYDKNKIKRELEIEENQTEGYETENDQTESGQRIEKSLLGKKNTILFYNIVYYTLFVLIYILFGINLYKIVCGFVKC